MLTDTLFPWFKSLGLDEIQVNDETILFGFTSLQTEGICRRPPFPSRTIRVWSQQSELYSKPLDCQTLTHPT